LGHFEVRENGQNPEAAIHGGFAMSKSRHEMRVISLLASGTEIVCALGLGDTLVGRSHECDNPAWVRHLPSLSAPTFDVSVSSREIDSEVTRRIRAGEPLYQLDSEQIWELKPDLVITQAHCEVCAVTPGDVERSGCATPAAQVMALTAGTLDGIFEGMLRVAEALGVENCGQALVAAEKARLQQVTERCRGKHAPSVVLLEWTDPIFAMGNWGPELVEAANGNLLIGHKGEHSRAIPWETVRDADPEVLVIAPCGFDLERALLERSTMEALDGWHSLSAVRHGKVAYADGNRFFNRSGMTVTQTAEILAEMLHGEVFGEPTEGVHWQWA
jgi:iron complex transport system substrate-binding protein